MSEPRTSRNSTYTVLSEAVSTNSIESVTRQIPSIDRPHGAHLQRVIDQFRGRLYNPDPIGRAVVEAILLDAGFPKIDEPAWVRLVEQVAGTLHEDPVSLRKLQRMWGAI